MSNQDRLMQLFLHLKNEIIGIDSRNTQFLTLIVTATGVILTMGFNQANPERPWIFLCVYVFLIPAYSILYGNRRHGWRISTYLRVFVEPHLEEIKWETRLDKLQKTTRKIEYTKLSSGISSSEFKMVVGLSLITLLALFVNYLQIILSKKIIFSSDYQSINGLLSLIVGFVLFLLFYFKTNKIAKDLQRNGVIEQSFYDSWQKIKMEEEHSKPNKIEIKD